MDAVSCEIDQIEEVFNRQLQEFLESRNTSVCTLEFFEFEDGPGEVLCTQWCYGCNGGVRIRRVYFFKDGRNFLSLLSLEVIGQRNLTKQAGISKALFRIFELQRLQSIARRRWDNSSKRKMMTFRGAELDIRPSLSSSAVSSNLLRKVYQGWTESCRC